MRAGYQESKLTAERRGREAGERDGRRCELVPAECVRESDAWLRAYRAAWARRAVTL